MLASEKLAIAAHLHVLLRRKTGRVTDTEWLAQNAEYAAEIIRFARLKAVEDGHPELLEWAAKLEQASVPSPGPARPLAQVALQALRERYRAPSIPPVTASPKPGSGPESTAPDPAPQPGPDPARAAPNPRYVGGIR